jgi:uncharacterized RDD family membrane protein YckC
MADPADPAAIRHRRVLHVAIACAFAVLLEFVVPFAGTYGFMFSRMFTMRPADVRRAASYDGRLWTVEQRITLGSGPKRALRWIDPADPARTATAGDLDIDGTVWLLVGSDRLWIVGSSRTGWMRDGRIELTKTPPIGWIQRAYLRDGVPVLVERASSSYVIHVWKDGAWTVERKIAPGDSQRSIDLILLASGGREWMFVDSWDALHYIPPDAVDDRSKWEEVASMRGTWTVVDLGGEPAAFCIDRGEPNVPIVGFKRGPDGWKEFFRYEAFFGTEVGVVPTGGRDFVVLVEGFPGDTRVVRESGRGFHFPMMFTWLTVALSAWSLLVPLLLALVLSRIVTKSSSPDVEGAPRPARYATLTRRGAAHIVDTILQSLPLWIGLAIFVSEPSRILTKSGFMAAIAVYCGTFVFWGLAWVAFTFMEGWTGRTPGKWLCGIRVVKLDLTPCGLGPAFLRNLLRIGDAFMNYVVGLASAAITERRQRLGDLVAKTIVIRG